MTQSRQILSPFQAPLSTGRMTETLIAQQWTPLQVNFGHFIIDSFLNPTPNTPKQLRKEATGQRLILSFNPERLNWISPEIETNLEQQGIVILNDHDPPHEERRLITGFFEKKFHTLIVSSRKLTTQSCRFLLLKQPNCVDQVIIDSLYWSAILPNWHQRFGGEWLTDIAAQPAIITAKEAYIAVPLISQTGFMRLSDGLSIDRKQYHPTLTPKSVLPLQVHWRFNEYFKWQLLEDQIQKAPTGSTFIILYQPWLSLESVFLRLGSLNVRYAQVTQKMTENDFHQLNTFLGENNSTSLLIMPYDAFPLLDLPRLIQARPVMWNWICWHPPWTIDLLASLSLDARLPEQSCITVMDCHEDWKVLKTKQPKTQLRQQAFQSFHLSQDHLQQLILEPKGCLLNDWAQSASSAKPTGSLCDQCSGCSLSNYSSSKWMKKVLQKVF